MDEDGALRRSSVTVAAGPDGLDMPADALIVLVGISGSGKSSWASTRFPGREILSSDAFREMVSDDAADQSASADAFRLLHLAARARLRRGLRTVIDATNLTLRARRQLLTTARVARRPAVAIVFDVPLERCLAQNARRAGRRVPESVLRDQQRQLEAARQALGDEGFSAVVALTASDLDAGYDAGMPDLPIPLPS